jgi:O-antigen/teichoic acid export membrane protein
MAMSIPCAFALIELGGGLFRKFDWRHFLLHWNFNFGLGRTLLVVTILTLLGDLFLRFVLGNIHSVQALGRLAAALVTVTFFNPIQLTVQSLTRAKVAMSFVGGDRVSILEQTRASLLLTAKYMGLLYLLLSIFGGSLAEILFWRHFSGIEGIIVSLSVAAYLQTLSFPAEAALTSLRQGKTILISSILRCLLLTILGVPLIYSFEIVGFGIAIAISFAASIAYQWLELRRVCSHAT